MKKRKELKNGKSNSGYVHTKLHFVNAKYDELVVIGDRKVSVGAADPEKKTFEPTFKSEGRSRRYWAIMESSFKNCALVKE